MATLFVDKLDPQSGTALEIGSSGDTITIPSGATLTNNGTATGFDGLSDVSQWRLTAAQQLTTADVTANLERVDTSGQGTIGSAMSESSGIFTFPSTGIYMVRFDASWYQASGAGGARYIIGRIKSWLQDPINELQQQD